MKIIRYISSLSSLLKDPISVWEYYAMKKLSRESYMMIVSLAIACCGFMQGYLVVHTNLIVSDSQFLNSFHQWATQSKYDSARIDDVEHFWSLLYCGEIIGALISFPFVDNFGRKLAYAGSLVGCLFCLSWMVFTTSLVNVLTLRFGIGVCLGILMVSALIYIAEITESFNRGQSVSLLFLSNIGGSWACLLSYPLCRWIWPLSGWRIACLVPLMVNMISLYVISFLPDSPRFLLAKKTPTDCARALKQLRYRVSCNPTICQQASHHSINVEFNDMYRGLSNDARLGDSYLDLCNQKPVRHRLYLFLFIFVLQGLLNGMIAWWCVNVFQEVLAADVSTRNTPFSSSNVGEEDVSSTLGYAKFYLYSLTLGASCFVGCWFLHQRIDLTLRLPVTHPSTPKEQHRVEMNSQAELQSYHQEFPESATASSAPAETKGGTTKSYLDWVVGRRGLMMFSGLSLMCVWLAISCVVYLDSNSLHSSRALIAKKTEILNHSSHKSAVVDRVPLERTLRGNILMNETRAIFTPSDGPSAPPSPAPSFVSSVLTIPPSCYVSGEATNDTAVPIAIVNSTTIVPHKHRNENIFSGRSLLLLLRQLIYLMLMAALLFSYSSGWGYIPSLLVVEYLPYRARTKLFSILSVLYYAILQTVFRYYSHDATDLSTGFSGREWNENAVLICLGCAGISLLITVFSWWLLPETADVMLEDVEEMFRSPFSDATTNSPAVPNASLFSGVMMVLRGQWRQNLDASCSCLLPPWHYYFPSAPFESNKNITKSYHSLFTPARTLMESKHPKITSGGSRGKHVPEDHPFYEPTSLHKYSREMRETSFHYCADNNCSANSNVVSIPPTHGRDIRGYGSIYQAEPFTVGVEESDLSETSSTASFSHLVSSFNGNNNGIGGNRRGEPSRSCSVFGVDNYKPLSDKIEVSPFTSSWPFRGDNTP